MAALHPPLRSTEGIMKLVRSISTVLLICITLGIAVSTTAAERQQPAACENGEFAYIYLTVTTFPSPYWNCSLDLSVPVRTIYVQALAQPCQRVRLSLPNPPIGQIINEQWNFPFTGDRINGMELDLGNCSTGGDITLGTILIFAAPSGCPVWQVNAGAEVQDCDANWHQARELPSNMGCVGQVCMDYFQYCPGLPPFSLNPPDGATDVPTNVELTWVEHGGYSYCGVRISTDPACGSGSYYPVDCGAQSYSPSFLQPETTYYWQVSTTFDACAGGGLSPVHSFTTEGPVSATPTTWGRVKVLYSD